MSKSFKEVVRKGVAPELTFGTNPMNPWAAKSNIAEGRKTILSRYILSLGIDPSALSNDTLISYAKSNEFIKWNSDRKLGMSESVNDVRDTVTVNIPLLIRLLELAREDVKTDVELHNIVERMINLRRTVPLTMKHYRQIAGKATRRVVREEKEVEDDNEVKVFDYQTKYFHICAMATELYTDIENKVNIDSYDLIEGMAKLQDVIFFIEKHLKEKKGSPKEDDLGYLLIAQNIKDQLDRMIQMVNPDMRLQHGYLQGHIETIKKLLDYDNRKAEMNEESDPCWTGYKQIGMKKKNGRQVPNCVPSKSVTEGGEKYKIKSIGSDVDKGSGVRRDYYISPSTGKKVYKSGVNMGDHENPNSGQVKPKVKEYKESYETLTKHTSGTDTKRDSLVARAKAHKEIKTPPGSMSQSAKIIKELFRKKVMEDMYDWEKEDKSIQTYGKKPKYEKTDDKENNGENKPTARAVMSGGTTLTGKSRDIIEIDPMMRNRPGQPDVTKKKDDKKKESKTDK